MEFEDFTQSSAFSGTISGNHWRPMAAAWVAQAKAEYYLANFSSARVLFARALDLVNNQETELSLEILTFLTRINLEQENQEELLKCVLQLRQFETLTALSSGSRARIFNTLGIVHYAEPQGKTLAFHHFERAIQLALESNDREPLVHAVYGCANVFYALNQYEKAKIELDKLDQILAAHPTPEISVSALLLKSFIDRNEGNTLDSLEKSRRAMELLRERPNIYLYLQALYALGSTYLKVKDLESAQIYLELAKVSCSPTELPRLHRVLSAQLTLCRNEIAPIPGGQITYDRTAGTLKRSGIGSVSLQGQFVLRDLLALLLESPEKEFSKEELVEKVWGEKYSPTLHDNKIYVNLKRLRQALEPLFQNDEAIIRTRHGYTFNHKLFTRILIGSENS